MAVQPEARPGPDPSRPGGKAARGPSGKGLLFGVRFLFAFLLSRVLVRVLKAFGYSATSLPGVIALKVCPGLISHIGDAYELVVAVTGTNGKTTTANLLAHILRADGYTVAHNTEGANMLNGVAAALLQDCTWTGEPRSRVALIEVDEGSVGRVFAQIKPDLLVVTNYFRDQLDRYFEIDRTAALLLNVVQEISGLKLVMNGDDPLVAAIGHRLGTALYYGAEGELRMPAAAPDSDTAGETRERGYCSLCGGLLQYRYYHYGQLGSYRCSQCSFERPALDFTAFSAKQLSPVSFTISSRFFPGGRLECASSLHGCYNLYNVLAAASASAVLGISGDTICAALPDYQTATGRLESFVLGGRPCTLALIKNPAGLNEVIKTVLVRPGGKSLVIAINDLAADGRDVSWLWDADFEKLCREDIVSVTCAGRRAADMAVRMKYAGLPVERIGVVPDASEALKDLSGRPGEELYVLATYTNLFNYAKLLHKAEKSSPPVEETREKVGRAS
ncbi:MAG: DUF1727 domain-containing protein [Firmicutes bacterium]|nr:DUF1727 domain-containing protein [Bacillota bacterium]